MFGQKFHGDAALLGLCRGDGRLQKPLHIFAYHIVFQIDRVAHGLGQQRGLAAGMGNDGDLKAVVIQGKV